MESKFETGANSHEVDNFILTLDSTREAREKLIPVLREVRKYRNNYPESYLINLIVLQLVKINGTLQGADRLTLIELFDAAEQYYKEAINATENDLQ